MTTLEESKRAWKEELGKYLRKFSFIVNEGIEVPLLTDSTRQIVIDCNNGKISGVKPTYNIR